MDDELHVNIAKFIPFASTRPPGAVDCVEADRQHTVV